MRPFIFEFKFLDLNSRETFNLAVTFRKKRGVYFEFACKKISVPIENELKLVRFSEPVFFSIVVFESIFYGFQSIKNELKTRVHGSNGSSKKLMEVILCLSYLGLKIRENYNY